MEVGCRDRKPSLVCRLILPGFTLNGERETMIRISELRSRDVVNVNDGRRMGIIVDLDVDLEKGKVNSIIIPAPGGIWGKFTGGKDLTIPWEKIIKIGIDTILVDYAEESFTARG